MQSKPLVQRLTSISCSSFPFLLYRIRIELSLPPKSSECRIHDRQTLIAANEIDIRNAEHLAQLVIRHLHWSWRVRLTGLWLRKGRRTRSVESDIPFHLLH